MALPLFRFLLVPALALTSVCATASGEEADGKIVTASPEGITIGKKKPRSFKISASTVIMVNGEAGTIEGLKEGMLAAVSSADGVAASITAKDVAPKDPSAKKTKKGKPKAVEKEESAGESKPS